MPADKQCANPLPHERHGWSVPGTITPRVEPQYYYCPGVYETTALEIIAEAIAEHPYDRTWSGEDEAKRVLIALRKAGFRVDRPDVEYGIGYHTPTGREFVVMRDRQMAVERIKANPDRGWTLAMRDRAVGAGPWLVAQED